MRDGQPEMLQQENNVEMAAVHQRLPNPINLLGRNIMTLLACPLQVLVMLMAVTLPLILLLTFLTPCAKEEQLAHLET